MPALLEVGFWATGEAKRLTDPRSTTIEGYLRVLAEARPKAFLLENVEGLGFRGKDEGLKLIQQRLAAINAAHGTNYRASIAILNAADFGVPQVRRRIFVIGSREGAPFDFPEPTHFDPRLLAAEDNRPRYVTAWDALHDLPEPLDPAVKVRGKWADLLPSIPEGENYLWHTDRGGESICSDGAGDTSHSSSSSHPSIGLLGGVGGGLAPARLVQDLGLVLVSIS